MDLGPTDILGWKILCCGELSCPLSFFFFKSIIFILEFELDLRNEVDNSVNIYIFSQCANLTPLTCLQ